MKKALCVLICAILCLMPTVTLAETLTMGDTLYMYTAAPLYDSYEKTNRRVLEYIPSGSVVMYMMAIDWGYCVAYGNHLGYIENPSCRKVNAWENLFFDWPGSSSAPSVGSTSTTEDENRYGGYVPEFPYTQIYCVAKQRLATRSGPGVGYVWTEYYPQSTDVRVLYQTEGNGVMWGCYEFMYEGQKYRVYTGMERVDVWTNVPSVKESSVPARITATHTPHFGPGFDYASSIEVVNAGTAVSAFWQQNGWLMYEYPAADGKTLRAWCPPGCWT